MLTRFLIPIAAGALAVLLVGAALAQGRAEGRGPGPGGGRLVYGVITQIDATQIVIEPQIPPDFADRMAETGRELPELPEEVVIPLADDTKYRLNGEEADRAAFGVGDTVVVLRGRGDDGPGAARAVADPDSARQFAERMMGNRGEGRRGQQGPGMRGGGGMQGPGGEGRGGRMGPGGEGPGGMLGRPVFGEITKISGDQVTVKIEIPDFIMEKMDEAGRELPADMPEEITLIVGKRTRYMSGGEMNEANPFNVGDDIAAMTRLNINDEPEALVISDLAGAEEFMARMRERRGGDGGPEDGDRPGRGRRGGRGNRDGGPGGPGANPDCPVPPAE
ncbi:hypothetical protein JW859_03365 [bacterium]|nr:hypothetical protein [bacterium]